MKKLTKKCPASRLLTAGRVVTTGGSNRAANHTITESANDLGLLVGLRLFMLGICHFSSRANSHHEVGEVLCKL